MKPLIVSLANAKFDNFEKTRLRKNIKGSLELNNASYCVSFYDETYRLIHFTDIEDYKKYRNEIKPNIKTIISLFYTEEDHDGRILEKHLDGTYSISKGDIPLYNEFNLVLVPCEEAKRFLILNGITTMIDVFEHGVNVTKFSIADTYVRNIAYRYLKCPSVMGFIVTTLDYRDEEAFRRVNELAVAFPKLKFIAIYHSNFLSYPIKKLIKKAPSNLTYTLPLDEDIYVSLTYNAKIYLFIGSNKGCVIQNFEAMASETQIIALKDSVFNDIIIDKENGYVYNDFASLKEGISLFIDGKLPSTTTKAKEIAVKNSLLNSGKKLITIYNNI